MTTVVAVTRVLYAGDICWQRWRTTRLQRLRDAGEVKSVQHSLVVNSESVHRGVGLVSLKLNVALMWLVHGLRLRLRGSRPPINRGLPTKPFQFYFSLMIDVYEITSRALLITVLGLVRHNLSWAPFPHQLNPALLRGRISYDRCLLHYFLQHILKTQSCQGAA